MVTAYLSVESCPRIPITAAKIVNIPKSVVEDILVKNGVL
jgi:hypothetical protein